MFTYLKRLWLALIGRAEVIVQTVEVEKEVIRDLSLNKHDIEEANKAFPHQIWKTGVILEDFARSEGEHRVIAWFTKRVGAKHTQVR